jgi:hypothetical protein
MDNKVDDIAADTNSAEHPASRGQVRNLITAYFTEVIHRQGADDAGQGADANRPVLVLLIPHDPSTRTIIRTR